MERIWVVSGIADQRTIGTTSDANYWMVAYPLQIRWRDSDTSRFYPAATVTTTVLATAEPTSATVIGLAVGCAVLAVMILLGIAAILVYRRSHLRQLGQALRTGRGEAAGPGMTEMPDFIDKVLPLTTN